MTQKITILNLCINLEKLGRNLNFTVEYKIGNLHREKLCLNLSFTVESKIGIYVKQCSSHFKLYIMNEIF